MSTVLTLLAVAGIAAAAWHFVRAAFGFLRHGATGYWTGEMARNYARRGDVTGMRDADRTRATERRSKRQAGMLALGWLALLAAPSFTSWAVPIYAGYTALWGAPLVRRVRRTGRGSGPEGRVGR